MADNDIHIIPYNESMHDEVMRMERGITQGTGIQLELIKRNFISRAVVFGNCYSSVAVSGPGMIVGSASGSIIPLTVNDRQFEVGFGFDAKVMPGMRRKGIGKMLAKDLYKNFFRPAGMSKCFMTAKLANGPILRVVGRALGKIWLYPFAYLSIPTNRRVNHDPVSTGDQEFSVVLHKRDLPAAEYYTESATGLGYFHTWMLYTLRIWKIGWMVRTGIRIMKMVDRTKHGRMPKEGDVLSFATLFNHTKDNIGSINGILEQLEEKKIEYLLVCCRKNDDIYKYLKKLSINTYKYYIVSDFRLDKHDSVSVDVRCL